ncbi:MAG TPA: OB-fold domain-containing protein [Acidimicrobiales bacterium]
MRGIIGHGAYLPHRRLDRTGIAAVVGTGGGKGTRTVASYDEDTTTMGVEAGRLVLRALPDARPGVLWFSTTAPAYADRTNATAVHAALRLDRHVLAADANGAARSGVAVLRAALESSGMALVVAADLRTGLPGGPDEAAGGDGASAVLVGADPDGEVLAEYLGAGTATEEFLDRWRAPGEVRSKLWEERFGEGKYTALGEDAWAQALKQASLTAGDVDHLVVAGTHGRAVAAATRRLAGEGTRVADTLAATVGHTGAAHPGLLLSSVLETAAPDQVIALVSLADGADVLLFRSTPALSGFRPARPLAAQLTAGGPIAYGKFLAWRGLLAVEPPRRPEPARVSASAAGRSEEWKFGFVGSRDTDTGEVRMPPAVPGADPDAHLEAAPMADVAGTVVTYTVDRLAYSPSPPVVFAVVDFDGGGRLPIELTDVDPDDVHIGQRVEATFRRLSTADGIHNYFWKARPI